MKKLLREPVLHFALLGVLLFVWFSLVNNDRRTIAERSDEIIISEGTRSNIGTISANAARSTGPAVILCCP